MAQHCAEQVCTLETALRCMYSLLVRCGSFTLSLRIDDTATNGKGVGQPVDRKREYRR